MYNQVMKIILLRDIAKLGKRGEVQEVADGYALNVLIKKGDALRATPEELSKWKAKEASLLHKKEIASSAFSALVDTLRKSPVIITGKKSDSKGQLFASIKEADIADAIFTLTKTSLDPKQIIIASPIKAIGEHTVELKQGTQKEKIVLLIK